MARFTYKVIVDVPDDDIIVDNDDIVVDWSLDINEDGKFSPETLSAIVMSERLGHDDDYGFDYKIDWEDLF